eukprot:4999498-Pleurochrysis_carterae.AAC.11
MLFADRGQSAVDSKNTCRERNHRVKDNLAGVRVLVGVCVVKGGKSVERDGHRLGAAARVAWVEMRHGRLGLVKRDHRDDGALARNPLKRTPERLPAAPAPGGGRRRQDEPVLRHEEIMIQAHARQLVHLFWKT